MDRTDDNIVITGAETTSKEQHILVGQTAPQMSTITYNDEAAPRSRSNCLMGTRLLPSSDDNNDNFLEPLGHTPYPSSFSV
jgi:hypothetical protein